VGHVSGDRRCYFIRVHELCGSVVASPNRSWSRMPDCRDTPVASTSCVVYGEDWAVLNAAKRQRLRRATAERAVAFLGRPPPASDRANGRPHA
jgi:hypothetical protein